MAGSRRSPPRAQQGQLLGGSDEPAHGVPPLADTSPLADRMRPDALEEVFGQEHLLSEGGALQRAIRADRVPSMILWGPPGSGKTTLAHVISKRTSSAFETLNAVLGGVADVRKIVQRATERRQALGERTMVFVDEIHRFNKAQQDAFLPYVENGVLTLVGATTDNPSFSVNAAILSRCQVFRLDALPVAALVTILSRALRDVRRGLGVTPGAGDGVLERVAELSRGDARRALTLLESVVQLSHDAGLPLSEELVDRCRSEQPLLYDKAGEEHYNVVSALIKSLRGSDPDAAIYWLMRMLDAGDDPLFVLRRLLIFASEDVGNADPRALSVAVSADAAFRRMGMPEGLYPIAHACLYLASCPKSNSVGKAFRAAREAIQKQGALPVPLSLRNAVTPLMQKEGYAAGYRYPHDERGHHARGATYLPEALIGETFYDPSDQGLERSIAERLARLRREDAS